jgi:starvation-inducible DNA-binding protein
MEIAHDSDFENVPRTQRDTTMAKARPVKLGWSDAEIKKITAVLNELLANYSVHYQKLRNYHWNVKGSDFFDLHERFEQQYNEARVNIDEVAERIRVFGEVPLSTMADYLRVSEITGTDLDSDVMVREVLTDFRILLQHLFSSVEVAASIGDSGTEELLKGFIKGIEKHHWMMSSFLAS